MPKSICAREQAEAPEEGEAQVLARIIETYGTPQETAEEYIAMEQADHSPFPARTEEAAPARSGPGLFGVLVDPQRLWRVDLHAAVACDGHLLFHLGGDGRQPVARACDPDHRCSVRAALRLLGTRDQLGRGPRRRGAAWRAHAATASDARRRRHALDADQARARRRADVGFADLHDPAAAARRSSISRWPSRSA